MEMILLDWTRMGTTYCLAGAVAERGGFRIVRPLLARNKNAMVRKAGWSPYLLDGHSRWEIFELIGPQAATPEPPHVEDLWVRAIRSCGRLATPQQRRTILEATIESFDEPLFGAQLSTTRAAAYLEPGTGQRSLTTLMVASTQLFFTASRREGTADTDFRVTLNLAGIGERSLAVKDHHLLLNVANAPGGVPGQIESLHVAVRRMGAMLAMRLGLSRPFAAGPHSSSSLCWLMADGFFSLSDPQP